MENKTESQRVVAARIHRDNARFGSLVKLYESASNIVAALAASTSKGDKLRSDFAQKELEKFSKWIEEMMTDKS